MESLAAVVDNAGARRSAARAVRSVDVYANESGGYDFEGPTRYDRLFSGVTLGPMPEWMAANLGDGLEDFGPGGRA